MTSDPYTPDEAGARLAYVDGLFASGTRNIKEQREELRAEFDRFVAKIKATALREALEDLDDAGLDSYAANEVGTWIGNRADRIEEEA